MSQTKKESLLESASNVLIGFTITIIASFIVYPMFGVQMSPLTNVWVTITFTLISLIRAYIIRRWFNKKEEHLEPSNTIKENDIKP